MSKSFWDIGGPVPEPGDLDADVERFGPDDVEHLPPNPDAIVSLLIKVRGDDALALGRLARERGESVETVVAELVRAAAAAPSAKR